MTNEESGAFFKGDWQIHRRRFLTGTAAVAVGGAAGCSSLTNQEFEAQPVGLPEEAREELVLGENARDSSTVTREIDAIDGEISITSFSAAYSRGKAFDLEGADYAPRPSLLGRYLQQVNGTNGPGAAAVAAASDVGLDEVTIGDFAVDGDRVSLVAPAGVRDGEGGSGAPGIFSLMYPSEVSPEGLNEVMNPENGTNGAYVIDAKNFFPGLVYDPIDRGWALDPIDRGWMPAGYTGADDLMDGGKVMIALDPALTPEKVFGVSAEEMPGERIEDGEEFARATGNNPFLVAAPDTVTSGNQSPVAERYKNFFDAGVPTWVGGATYGVGVLATPAARVAGQSVNPVAGMSFEELLTGKRFGHLIGPNRLQKTDEGDWLAGPEPVANPPRGHPMILGQETELQSFLGVLSGEDGPWGVGVHMTRVENEHEDGTDVVVTAAVHRWPVGSADNVSWIDGDADERFTGILGSIITKARALTAAAGEQYISGDANMS